MNENENKIYCNKCGKPLTKRPVTLEYMGHHFNVDVPGCADCGQIYISEDLVRGKMTEVEKMLEEK